MLNGIRDMAEAAGLRLIDICFWGEDTEQEEADTWTIDPAAENDDRRDESGKHDGYLQQVSARLIPVDIPKQTTLSCPSFLFLHLIFSVS